MDPYGTLCGGGNGSKSIVRIGLQKFIVDVVDDDIKYVMDLC